MTVEKELQIQKQAITNLLKELYQIKGFLVDTSLELKNLKIDLHEEKTLEMPTDEYKKTKSSLEKIKQVEEKVSW